MYVYKYIISFLEQIAVNYCLFVLYFKVLGVSYTIWQANIDMDIQKCPGENDLQMMGFPSICWFTGG